MEDLVGIALRVSILYLFVLVMLRLTGKRSIGNLSPLDFAIATMLGDFFDDVIWGEVPVSKGIVALTIILLLHTLVSYLTYKNDRLDALFSSTKTDVVHNGRFLPKGLGHERTSKMEAMSEIRLQGDDKIKDIQEASWEPSGRISVLKKEEAKPAQKKDRPALLELIK